MKIENSKNKLVKRIAFAAIIVSMLVVALIIYLSIPNTNPQRDTGDGMTSKYNPQPESSEDSINQQKTSNSAKNDTSLEIKDQGNVSDDSSSRDLNIVITDASQYDDTVEVRAFANEVSSKALCVTTFSKGRQKVTKRTTAIASATTTSCGAIDVPVSDFMERGRWSVTVSYSSKSGDGTSKPAELVIR